MIPDGLFYLSDMLTIEEEEIVENVRLLSRKYDFVFTSGGIGY